MVLAEAVHSRSYPAGKVEYHIVVVERHKDSEGAERHRDSVEYHTLNKALVRHCRVVPVPDTDSVERQALDEVLVRRCQAALALHCRVALVPDLELDPKP